jgi:hypothetical protein
MDAVKDAIREGTAKARREAVSTMEEVRSVVGVNPF